MDETEDPISQNDPGAYPEAFHDYTRDADFVGVGGFGVVFRACHVRPPHKVVAVKFLKADFAKVLEYRRRFVAEGLLLQRLDHKNCVRVSHAGEREGVPYILMEFVAGKNVHEMTPSGGLDPQTAAAIVAQAARGLHYAHTLRPMIVHRDVKPSNILYDPGAERAVVTDFGLATSIADPLDVQRAAITPLTPFGESTLGTVFYTPPEYVDPPEGEDVIAPAGDIYSLGATFYELLSGRPPFPVDGVLDGSAKFRAIAEIRHKKRPRALPAHVPRSIRRICERAMHRNRAARYSTAAELALALETALHQIRHLAAPLARTRLRNAFGPAGFARRRGTAIMLVAGAAALAAWFGRAPGGGDRRPSSEPPSIGASASARTAASTRHASDDARAQSTSALAIESRALDAYDETTHPNERLDVRFGHARRLFDQMRADWPRYVRGRITYLNCLMDFVRAAPQADAEAAAQVGLTVLAELDQIGLGDADRNEISVYRGYFEVFRKDDR